jgi:hypothetical protein
MNIPVLVLLVFAAWPQLGPFQATNVSQLPWSGSSPDQLGQTTRQLHHLEQAAFRTVIHSVLPNISL